MAGKQILLTFIMALAALASSFAQSNTDAVYRPEIKSVQCYNGSKEGSFPLITLGSSEQLVLAFDDISGNSRDYMYSLQHCEADWALSAMSSAEYMQSFNEDHILDYTYSSGTLQKYIHYQVKLPNQNIIPKISGNYLLKVYESGNSDKPVLTRRVYVLNPKVGIAGEATYSSNLSLRTTNQKINFQLDYSSLPVQNPYNALQVLLMQNARPDVTVVNTQPYQIQGNRLLYTDLNTNDLPGGNEFRYIDLRTLKLNSERVNKIFRDTANTVTLLNDFPRDQPNYVFLYDNDGNFFIRNQDGVDPTRDADYAHVYFNMAANRTDQQGDVYLIGKFNDYQLNNDSKLSFDPIKKRFFTEKFLKQGIYDYQYVWVDKAVGKPDYTALEGSHFETENDYQLLVYYHPAGARWTELVGYRVLNTARK